MANWVRQRLLGYPAKPEGTEGAATVKLTNDKGEEVGEAVGFIVRNNDKLTSIMDPRKSYLDKYKNTKYFMYVPNVPQCEAYGTAMITVVHSTQPTSKTFFGCKVEETEKTISKVGDNHFFIPCESVDFNNNSFLRKYSKDVLDVKDTATRALLKEEENFKRLYGLSDEKNKLVEIELRQQSNTALEIDDNVFEDLIDGPILLDNKTIVAGCVQKQISICGACWSRILPK